MAEAKPGENRQSAGSESAGAGGERHMIPVWFFVGILLFIYGILIFFTGISEWSHPPDTTLSSLHPTFWWGIVLIIIGAIFTFAHFPGRKKKT